MINRSAQAAIVLIALLSGTASAVPTLTLIRTRQRQTSRRIKRATISRAWKLSMGLPPGSRTRWSRPHKNATQTRTAFSTRPTSSSSRRTWDRRPRRTIRAIRWPAARSPART